MKSKALFLSLIFFLIGALLVLQINTTLAFTSVENNPITAPITVPIIDPTPTPDPITSPIIDPSPTPTPTATHTLTPAPAQPSQSNKSSSGSSSPQAPICGDSKPVSAPKLVNAFASGKNEVTLIWSRALDPVSYYLVAYGTKPNQPEFGNPNIGSKYTISYIVTNLSGNTTYYFKVRAGNGCMPGDFSNEVAVKTTGPVLTTPATGFKAGVLGKTTQKLTVEPKIPFQPITEAKPARMVVSTENFLTKVWNFFSSLFKR